MSTVMIGTDVRARLFILAPADVIPWHSRNARLARLWEQSVFKQAVQEQM
jgi:hypothetical protein